MYIYIGAEKKRFKKCSEHFNGDQKGVSLNLMVSIPSLWSYHSFCPNLTLLSLKAAESAFIVKRERETESEKIAERLTICTKLYICRAEVTRQMYNRVLREKKKKKKRKHGL